MSLFHSIGLLIRALFRNRAELAVENLALRQQLAILKEKTKRPKLRPRDRVINFMEVCYLKTPAGEKRIR